MATLAFFLALGGGAYAAIHLKKNSVKSKHIKNGQVKTADLAFGAVATQNIANDAVTPTELAPGAIGPDAFGPVVVRQAADTAGDGQARGISVHCEAGEKAIGGGGRLLGTGADYGLVGSYPIHADGSVPSAAEPPTGFDGWEIFVDNEPGGNTSTVTGIVYVVCLQ
jgi:hypothetical protein